MDKMHFNHDVPKVLNCIVDILVDWSDSNDKATVKRGETKPFTSGLTTTSGNGGPCIHAGSRMSALPEWKIEKISHSCLFVHVHFKKDWDSSYMRNTRKERLYRGSFLLRYDVRKSYYNSWLKLYGGQHNRNNSNEFLNEACKRSLWLLIVTWSIEGSCFLLTYKKASKT